MRRDPGIRTTFLAGVREGAIATCRFVVLELLREARDAGQLSTLRASLDDLRDFPIRRREWDRAADVLQALVEQGPLHHRQAPLPDLVVAAAAESAGVPVLHYDRHFELIAEVTGQPVRAIAPIGSL
jgi:predicted nucleic acid-binding protein